MSIIEGIGDEVTAFGVILLIIILAATVTFILNGTPFPRVTPQSVLTDSNSNELLSEQPENIVDSQNSDHREDSADGESSTTANCEEAAPAVETQNGHTKAVDDSKEQKSCDGSPSGIYPDVPEPSAPSEEEEEEETQSQETNLEPGQIRVRLKYLNDTERTVISNGTVKIIEFKRIHFLDEVTNNKIVRLIFSGQVLQDHATLQSYGVGDNCVVHVQISAAQARPSSSQFGPSGDLDLSHLLWPLLSVILGLCWILYFKYPDFFNVMSLGMLFVFTGSFVYFYCQVHNNIE